MVQFDELRVTPDGLYLIVSAHINQGEAFKDHRITKLVISNSDDFTGELEEGSTKYILSFNNLTQNSLILYSDENYRVGKIIEPIFYSNEECTSMYDRLTVLHLLDKRYYIERILDGIIVISDERYPDNKFYIQTELDLSSVNAVNSFLIPDKDRSYPKKIDVTISCSDVLCMNNFSEGLVYVYIVEEGEEHPCTPCKLAGNITLGVTFNTAILYLKALGYIKLLSNTCEISKDFIDFILQYEAVKSAVETEHYTEAELMFKRLLGSTDNITTNNCGCNGRTNI